MNCHKCGLEIEESDVFCGRCGASIESSQVNNSEPIVQNDSQEDIYNKVNSDSNDLNITNNVPGLAKTITIIRRKRVGGIISLTVVVIITAAIFVSFTKSSANQIKSETSAPVVTTQSATSSATTSVSPKQLMNETDQSTSAPETSQTTHTNEITVEIYLEGEPEEYIFTQYSSDLGYSIYYDKENFSVIPGQCIIGKPYEADQIILASNDGSYLDSYIEAGFIPNINGSQLKEFIDQGFHDNLPNSENPENILMGGKFFEVDGKGCYYAVMIYPEEATEGAAEIMQKMIDTFEVS